ncbi:MAG: hypothetical protein U0165_07775 [Polyangiaceae bacterium]
MRIQTWVATAARVGVLLIAVSQTGCGQLIQGLAPTYRTTSSNAKIQTGITEQIAHNFAFLHANQWESTLDKATRDAVPFLKALRDTKSTFELRITPYTPGSGSNAIETYEVEGVFTIAGTAKAKGTEIVLPGKQGTDESVYNAAAEKASKATGIPAPTIRAGHFALYGMVQMMTALNASHVTLSQRAFMLLVMKERVRSERKQISLDPNRPAAETNADVDDSIRVIAEHEDFLGGLRGEVLLLTTLSARYRDADGVESFEKTAAELKSKASAWKASHPLLTIEQLQEKFSKYTAKIDPMAQIEERFGFVASVAKIAQGIATGSISTTMDGVAGLTPKDSSVRVAINGLAAATRGDVVGAADAAAKLAGSSVNASDIKAGFSKLK